MRSYFSGASSGFFVGVFVVVVWAWVFGCLVGLALICGGATWGLFACLVGWFGCLVGFYKLKKIISLVYLIQPNTRVFFRSYDCPKP